MRQLIFPTIHAQLANGTQLTLPYEAQGEFNIALFIFSYTHYETMRTWLPKLQRMAQDNPKFHVYICPILTESTSVPRPNSDDSNIMSDHFATVLPLVVDKHALAESLRYKTQHKMQLFLFDREGIIHWRTSGDADVTRQSRLQRELTMLMLKVARKS